MQKNRNPHGESKERLVRRKSDLTLWTKMCIRDSKGVVPYTLPRHILVTPPLIITADEIDQILTAMDEVLTKAEGIHWGGE